MSKHFRPQTTLSRPVSLEGVGVHSGKPAAVTLLPAEAGRGILFKVRDAFGRERDIPALWQQVVSTELCTVIGVEGASIATIEHLMAALTAKGIDNAVVETSGGELPIMDGAAAQFLSALDEAGIRLLKAPRKAIRITAPVRVAEEDATVEFLPFDGCRYDVTIDFPGSVIGRQRYVLDLTEARFRHAIARARTFGFLKHIERLWQMGRALGSSLDNSVALGEDGVVNPEGLRYPDEFVRHKTLDAVGDLALAGMPFIGLFRSFKSGHRLNHRALQALFAHPSCFVVETMQDLAPLPFAEAPLLSAAKA